jgi:hypothetical protein
MEEGWYNDDYLILFDPAEVPWASDRYGVASALPGFQVIGLRGWDDFLVRDAGGHVFTIPSVPLDAKYLVPRVTCDCGCACLAAFLKLLAASGQSSTKEAGRPPHLTKSKGGRY